MYLKSRKSKIRYTSSIMAYAYVVDSYVEHLRNFTGGDMRFRYYCSFYDVSGMATDHKFQKTFDQLCFDRPKWTNPSLFFLTQKDNLCKKV